MKRDRRVRKARKSPRRYSARTLKMLWGRAAGRCSMPECRIDVIIDKTEYDPAFYFGDNAHISAASDKGPRGNKKLKPAKRDDYENLILLCKNCHTRVDVQKNKFPKPLLKEIKAQHEAWVRESLPERGRTTQRWLPIVVQGDHPIDVRNALKALAPHIANKPVVLEIPYSTDWNKALPKLYQKIRRINGLGDGFEKRFAIFPLAPVSACIATGYLLTNRPRVQLFQHHRDSASWDWPKSNSSDDLKCSKLPSRPKNNVRDVAVCYHISARIDKKSLPKTIATGIPIVHIYVPKPSVYWLQSPDQLSRLGEISTKLFGNLIQLFPRAVKWHLFFAGPAPGAVKVGQQINPTMCPPVQLYEFNRSSTPHYNASVILKS